MAYVICTILIVLTVLFAGMVGACLRSFVPTDADRKEKEFFFHALLGLLIIVIAYATVKSLAHSVMIVALVPLFALWNVRNRSTGSFQWASIFPDLRTVAVVTVVSAVVSGILYFTFETITLQEDSGNYLKIAESLRLTGQENTRHFRNVYSELFHGIEPYHYFEMWLGAFIMEFSGSFLPHLLAFRVVAYGIILTLTVLGLVRAFEKYGASSLWLNTAFALLFLYFVPNIFQLFFEYEKHFSYPVISNALVRLNFRTYWLFLLPPVILFMQKDNYRALLWMLFLPVISFTAAPAVCGALGLIVLFNRWLKLVSRKDALKFFGIMAAVGVLLLGMFSVLKMKEVGSLYSYTPDYIIGYYMLSWKAIVFTLFMEGVNVLLVYGPYMLLLLLIPGSLAGIKKFLIENRSLLIVVVFMTMAGIIFFQLTSFMNNAYQFTFIGYCAVTIVLPVLAFKASREFPGKYKQAVVYTFSVLLVLFSAYRLNEMNTQSVFNGATTYEKGKINYDSAYLAEFKAALKDEHAPGAFVGDSAYYQVLYYSKRLPDFYFPGSFYFSCTFTNDAYQYCLSDTAAIVYGYNGTARDRGFLSRAIQSSLFYMDYFQRGASGSIGERRKLAIQKYGIAYIVLTPGVRPDDEWSNLIEKEIVDKNSGETLVLLK